MNRYIRIADAKARVTLPKAFAKATVIVEAISESELHIRKASAAQEDAFVFREEQPTVLTNEARDWFLELLEKPPQPNAALRRLAMWGKTRE
jgi:uncharacterized protein (DUF1778 family)